MHARIDVLTHPCFRSLLPSRVLNWVVIIVSIHYKSVPLNTPLHPISVTSTTLHAVRTGLSSFRLVSVSTVPLCTSLHLWKRFTAWGDISFPRVAHITIFGIPGWAQLIENGLNRGRYSTLVKTQVCKCVVGQDEASHVLSYQES